MAFEFGGNDGMVQAVKAAGRTPGPLVAWFGSWTFGNLPSIDGYCAQAKAMGVPLLAQCWGGGDQLNAMFLAGEPVWDEHQEKNKTRAEVMALYREIGMRVAKSGVKAYFVVETEYNKGELAKNPLMNPYLLECMAVLKQHCPTGTTVLAPGDWHDLTLVAGTHSRMAFEKADAMGARTMRCAPRSKGPLPEGADSLLKAAVGLRKAWPDKPVLVTDFAIGTYGGPGINQDVKPFGAGADGKGVPPASAFRFNDEAQKATWERVTALVSQFHAAGVTIFCSRGYGDAVNAKTTNHYGYGERTFGVVRGDGSKKPAHPVVLALAKPATPPEPKTRTEAEYVAVVRERDVARHEREVALDEAATARRERDRVRATVETARTGVNAAKTALDSV